MAKKKKKKNKIRNLDRDLQPQQPRPKPFFMLPKREEKTTSSEVFPINIGDEEILFENFMQNQGIQEFQKDASGSKPRIKRNPQHEYDLDSIYPNHKFKGTLPQKNLSWGSNPLSFENLDRDFTADDVLDLHGDTQEQAIQKTQGFVYHSHRDRLQSILIITGKGLQGGEERGVLREVVWNWLRRNGKERISHFDWAPSFLGGSGAILIFLKSFS